MHHYTVQLVRERLDLQPKQAQQTEDSEKHVERALEETDAKTNQRHSRVLRAITEQLNSGTNNVFCLEGLISHEGRQELSQILDAIKEKTRNPKTGARQIIDLDQEQDLADRIEQW
ncbi:MAG: hypothetical protein OXU45_06675, partial [Candidatus Melainabacteria bacterium]|nr:hypothetical protein [Candidatus Melainabacteria bacterium]